MTISIRRSGNCIMPVCHHQSYKGEMSMLSPTPKKVEEQQLSFFDALREVSNGKKITRVEWNNPNSYGYFKDGLLMIHLIDTDHTWIINDGDLLAIDWMVLA